MYEPESEICPLRNQPLEVLGVESDLSIAFFDRPICKAFHEDNSALRAYQFSPERTVKSKPSTQCWVHTPARPVPQGRLRINLVQISSFRSSLWSTR